MVAECVSHFDDTVFDSFISSFAQQMFMEHRVVSGGIFGSRE